MTNERLEKHLNVAGACMIPVFPVLLLASDLVADSKAASGFVIELLAVWSFAACLIALCRKVWGHYPRLVVAAGAAGIFGVFGGVNIMTFRFVLGTLRQTGGAVGDITAFDMAVRKLTPFIFMPGLITPLVLCFLAAVLLKVEKAHRWGWVLVGLGALLFPLGRIFFGQAVILASDVCLLMGLGYAAWQLPAKGERLPTLAASAS